MSLYGHVYYSVSTLIVGHDSGKIDNDTEPFPKVERIKVFVGDGGCI